MVHTISDMGWLGGQWWWVAVAAGAGVIVGALRRAFKLPDDLPGLVADITTAHVDSKTVPGTRRRLRCGFIGGASLGSGESARFGGRWGRRLDVGPTQARRRVLQGRHSRRLRGRIRRVALQPSRCRDDGTRTGAPGRPEAQQGAPRRHHRVERVVRHLLRHRRQHLCRHLPGASVSVTPGTCWPGWAWECWLRPSPR